MNGERKSILKWLSDQSPVVDEIIAEAAQAFWDDHKNEPNFAYDLNRAQEESYLLSQGKDLCYDRFTLPLSYSLWYQGRRVNGCLSFFLDALMETQAEKITIFDLGAGTGAAQMAAEIVSYGLRKHLDIPVPDIHFVNIDSSPLMLEYNEQYLWPICIAKYPSNKRIKATFSLNSWHNTVPAEADHTWLATSYVFDVTDQVAVLQESFLKIIDQYSPSRIFLTSSGSKKKLVNAIASSAEGLQYNVQEHDCMHIMDGRMTITNSFRRTLYERYKAKGLNRDATFKESYLYSKILKKDSAGYQLEMIALYNEKITEINRIHLSEEQSKAASFRGRPSKIVGAAGSGKTIVICQKVAQLVKDADYSDDLQILITTFNKELVKLITKWVVTLLDEDKVDVLNVQNEYQISWSTSDTPNLHIMHFDILPTRFGKIKGNVVPKIEQLLLLEKIRNNFIELNLNLTQAVINKLDPEFLLEEYRRVFYGMNIESRDQYLQPEIIDSDTGTKIGVRTGRGEALQPHQKKAIYHCLLSYMTQLAEKGYSFIDRRRIFLKKLQNLELPLYRFDYVFIDEFQDCTRTDFKIFYHLLKDPNNLTITGDLAQSIHLGKSATSDLRAIKKINAIELRNFETFNLNASYRLPYRISESVENVSNKILGRWEKDNSSEKGNLLALRAIKNSFPGARPILVSGEDEGVIASKIRKIYKHYQGYGIEKFMLLENDHYLASQLWERDLKGRRDSILSMKGMETPFVIWSSRIEIDDPKEVYEYLYTIFTRTSSILVLALFLETLDIYREPLAQLREDRLIFWDEESEKNYKDVIKQV